MAAARPLAAASTARPLSLRVPAPLPLRAALLPESGWPSAAGWVAAVPVAAVLGECARYAAARKLAQKEDKRATDLHRKLRKVYAQANIADSAVTERTALRCSCCKGGMSTTMTMM